MITIEDLGEWFGYPRCCIDYFLISAGAMLNDEGAEAGMNTGFIPCPNCAKKVLDGKIKLGDLIKNRKAPDAFPNGKAPEEIGTPGFYWLSFSYNGRNTGCCNVKAKNRLDSIEVVKKLGICPKYDDVMVIQIPKVELTLNTIYSAKQLKELGYV